MSFVSDGGCQNTSFFFGALPPTPSQDCGLDPLTVYLIKKPTAGLWGSYALAMIIFVKAPPRMQPPRYARPFNNSRAIDILVGQMFKSPVGLGW